MILVFWQWSIFALLSFIMMSCTLLTRTRTTETVTLFFLMFIK